MDIPQSHNPTRLVTDKAKLQISNFESPFILNNNPDNERGLNTPMFANDQICDVKQPDGENRNIGSFFNPETEETYYWTYNSNKIHFISRISANGECDIVYDGEGIELHDTAENYITNFRAFLKVTDRCAYVPNGKLKQLIWVDGSDTQIGMVDVESSIATDSFSTSFFDRCRDNRAFVQMLVPKPQEVPNPDIVNTGAKQNRILDIPFKFMYRHVYYDGRRSEWSDKSALYFVSKDTCSGASGNCFKFSLPLGNAMVSQIEFAFSDDGGKDWYKADTIYKYDNLLNKYWFEQPISNKITLDGDCHFVYTFCNDKVGERIADDDAFRVSNPIPYAPQGLVPINDALGFYNYKSGTCPINRTELDKISLTIQEHDEDCKVEYVEVTVRAIIMTGYSMRISGGSDSIIKRSQDGKYFYASRGGLNNGTFEEAEVVGQVFKKDRKNFRVYVEGSTYEADMEQYYSSSGKFSDGVRVGDSGLDYASSNKGIHFQQAKIKVPKGARGFIRFYSHMDETYDRNHSEFVIGTAPNNASGNTPATVISAPKDMNEKEIYFDACNGDVEIGDKFFVLADLISTTGVSYSFKPIYGYIKDASELPVEGISIKTNTSGAPICVSDFNGFYFVPYQPSPSFPWSTQYIEGYAEKDCVSFTDVFKYDFNGSQEFAQVDFVISEEWYKAKTLNIYGRVVDCDNVPVPNVTVCVSGGKSRTTDEDGNYRFILRNYETRDRQIRIVIANQSECVMVDCNGDCNPCYDTFQFSKGLYKCFTGSNGQFVTLTANFSSDSFNAGLKHGGVYPFGIVLEYENGKVSPVYEVSSLLIPELEETGYTFPSIQYNAQGLNLPQETKNLKFVFARNRYNFKLQWIVDDVAINPNGTIRIKIQSLNDYATSHNFEVNTKYEFVEGDLLRVVRYSNGGLVADPVTYKILSPSSDLDENQKPDADFFNEILVAPSLRTIKKGETIEIISNRKTTEKEPYMGVGITIPVQNGQLIADTGTFDVFDTYFVKRNINGTSIALYENSYPSDFITYIESGDIYFKNPYENEERAGRNMMLNSPNVFNYFDGTERIFSMPPKAEIVAAFIRSDNKGLALTTTGEYVFSVSDNLLRVSEGRVEAAAAGQIVSDAVSGGRNDFGIRYDCISSVVDSGDFVSWLSRYGKYVINNFGSSQEAAIIKTEDGKSFNACASWFIRAIKLMDSGYRIYSGKDYVNDNIYITLRKPNDSFIDNDHSKEVFNTIIFSPNDNSFNGYASFVPEGYGFTSLEINDGVSFVTFKNGIPYVHSIGNSKYNEFYGVACDWVMGVVINEQPYKIKIPKSVEYNASDMFFVSQVSTNEDDNISEIPPIKFKQQMGEKWNAAFLNNKNTEGGLYRGKNVRGYYIYIKFVRDNTELLKYNTVDNKKRTKGGYMGNILTKSLLSEQSGFIKR